TKKRVIHLHCHKPNKHKELYQFFHITCKLGLDHGEKMSKSSINIEELLSAFTATLLRQVFLQIGLIPNRSSTHKVTLKRENWRLNKHRSVQYVQSLTQIEYIFWSEQQKEIGFEQQLELSNKYRLSKSKKPYSQWCRKHKT
ncbi:MAG: hypothetical protein NUV86_01850, partial [Candidatus Scalindua sp.]|nr:hypothetical protein [Candidatus Scalindua sp.]